MAGWACLVCTFVNERAETECAMCETSRNSVLTDQVVANNNGMSITDDSEDSNVQLPLTKSEQQKLKRQRKESERALAKIRKDAEKRADKIRKTQEKEDMKLKRAAEAQEAKRIKLVEKEELRAGKGAYADKETLLVLDNRLEELPLGTEIISSVSENYSVDVSHEWPVNGMLRWQRVRYDPLAKHAEPIRATIPAIDPDSVLDTAFENKDKSGWEDCFRAAPNFGDLHSLVLVCPSADYFVTCLSPESDNNPVTGGGAVGEFFGLRKMIRDIRSHLSANDKLMLLLVGVEKEIGARHRGAYAAGRRMGGGKPSRGACLEKLEEAMVWLDVHLKVQCKLVSSTESAAEFVTAVTRSLSELAYRPPVSEFSLVNKFRSQCLRPHTAVQPDSTRLADTWLHMIQCFPGVSEAKAQALLRHYPSLDSLLSALHAAPVGPSRDMLLQDKFGSSRREGALSKRIADFFTCEDSDQMV